MTIPKQNLIFGQNLRQLMEDRRVGLGALAREVGMPKSTLHNWMFGGKPGDFVALKKIADYFCVSIDEICFGTPRKRDNGFLGQRPRSARQRYQYRRVRNNPS